jgi:CHAT domain-containing protein/lipopolysaccharide biosynthesis regulator YciM
METNRRGTACPARAGILRLTPSERVPTAEGSVMRTATLIPAALLALHAAALSSAQIPTESNGASSRDAAREALRLAACGQPEEALQACRAALQNDADRLELQHLAVGLLADTRRSSQALAFITGLDSLRHPGMPNLCRGELLMHDQRWDEALAQLDMAVASFRENDQRWGLGMARVRQGRVLRELGRAAEARAALDQAIESAQPRGLGRIHMMALVELAAIDESQGDLEGSIALLREAVELPPEVEAPQTRLQAWDRLARAMELSNQMERVVDVYVRAAAYADSLDCVVAAIDLCTRHAADVFELGRIEEALALERSNLARARAAQHVELEASVLFNLARIQRRMGDLEGALATCEEMRELDARSDIGLKNRSRERLVRAGLLQETGRLRKALETLEPLDRDLEQLGEIWSMLVWNARANILLELGEVDVAIDLYERALHLAEQRKDRRRMAIYQGNLSGCYHRLGRYQEALRSYTECVQMFEELGQGFEIGLTRLNLANVQLRVGNLDAAVAETERALAAFEKIEAHARIPACLLTIGTIEIERRQFEPAREVVSRGLTQAEEQGNQVDVVRALFLLGRIDSEEGRFDDAAENLREVVRRTEEQDSPLDLSRALAALGDLERRSGRPEAARAVFERAIEVAHRLDSPRFDIIPHVGMARSLRELGQPAEALRHYRLAIENIEKVRWGTGAEEERWFVFGGNSDAYAEAALLLLEEQGESGDPKDPRNAPSRAEAFRLAEMGRARTLMDRLEQLGFDLGRDVPEELRQERRENLERYNYVHAKLLAARKTGETPAGSSATDVARLSEELQHLEEAYERIEGRIQQTQSSTVDRQEFGTVTDEEIRALLRPDEILLEYLVHGDAAWMFVIASGGETQAFALPEGLEEKVQEFRALLEAGRRPRAFDLRRYCDLAHELYLALVAPAFEFIGTTGASLRIAPDGLLWTIPFEALLVRPVEIVAADDMATLPFLFRESLVTYVPSSTVWRHLRLRGSRERGPKATPPHERGALVLADPAYPDREPAEEQPQDGTGPRTLRTRFSPLPHSRDEADRVQAVLGHERVEVHVGPDATEDRVKNTDLYDYRWIHFASHSYIDEEHPQRSAVVLSQDEDLVEDGFLTIREIYDLRLDADLVVLAACSTAGGQPIRGEGMIALARPFLASGASASLVTLWPINDRSTVEFMGAFYQALADGAAADAAARAARSAMLESPRPAWRLPYHWAAFVPVGVSR